MGLDGIKGDERLSFILLATFWIIWKERNRRFRGHKLTAI